MMSDNSNAITILCADVCRGSDVKPLTASEWADVAKRLRKNCIEPMHMLTFTKDELLRFFEGSISITERVARLYRRSGSISFELQKLKQKGIEIVTRADVNYPKLLKSRLKDKCPPLFYYVGDLEKVNQKKFIGFVGSRETCDTDIEFTRRIVGSIFNEGFDVVSGGARGVDSEARNAITEMEGFCIEFEFMLSRKIRQPKIIKEIMNSNLVLFSAVHPNAGFSAGNAMSRNKFIYALSEATVVVRSGVKGGTWSGAVENHKYFFTKAFCWDNKAYEGNQLLIKNGAATPIGPDFSITDYILEKPVEITPKTESMEQLTIAQFD